MAAYRSTTADPGPHPVIARHRSVVRCSAVTDPNLNQERTWTTRRVWTTIGAAAGVAVVLAVIGIRVAVDSGSTKPAAPVAEQTGLGATPATATPTTEATPAVPARTIDLNCSGDDDQDIAVTVAADTDPPDFTAAWDLHVHDCLVEAVAGEE